MYLNLTKKRKTNRKFTAGFTLIELLVVISIVSLLSSVVWASLSNGKVKAEDAKKISTVRTVNTAIRMAESNTGSVPANYLNSDGTANDAGEGDALSCEGGGAYGNTAYERSMQDLIASGAYSAIPKSPEGNSYCYFNYGGNYGEGAMFSAKLADGSTYSSGGTGGMGSSPGADTVTITHVLYDAITGRLTVTARSSLVSPTHILVLKGDVGFTERAMANLGGGLYQSVVNGLAVVPASVTVVSSLGGIAVEPPPPVIIPPPPFPPPPPDEVTITLVEYRTARGRLTVTARSSVVSPAIALTLKAGVGFPDVPMTNFGGGAYQVVLTPVPQPVSVTVVSNGGGTDTAPPPDFRIAP